MRQFEIVTYGGIPAVVVEADDLLRFPATVIAPLTEGRGEIPRLNPVVEFDGRARFLNPRIITTVRRADLDGTGIVLEDRRDEIVRAMDVLIGAY